MATYSSFLNQSESSFSTIAYDKPIFLLSTVIDPGEDFSSSRSILMAQMGSGNEWECIGTLSRKLKEYFLFKHFQAT